MTSTSPHPDRNGTRASSRVLLTPLFCSAPLRPATQDALDKAELEVPEIEWDLWLHECAMSAHRADEGG